MTIYHLVTDGDSLFGARAFACKDEPEEGDAGYLEVEKVTCEACKQTKEFKDLWEIHERDIAIAELYEKEQGTMPDSLTEELSGAVIHGVLVQHPEQLMALKVIQNGRAYWIETSKIRRVRN